MFVGSTCMRTSHRITFMSPKMELLTGLSNMHSLWTSHRDQQCISRTKSQEKLKTCKKRHFSLDHPMQEELLSHVFLLSCIEELHHSSQPLQEKLLTGSTCTTNYYQHLSTSARGTYFHWINIVQEELLIRINMQEELLTGSTCKRNFSQDQHAPRTFHSINMQEELLTGSTCKRNFSQDQHARRTSQRINMHEELFTGWKCTRNSSKD